MPGLLELGLGHGCRVQGGIGYREQGGLSREGSYHELQTSDITFDKQSALMAPNHKKKDKKKTAGKCQTIARCGCSVPKEDEGRRTLTLTHTLTLILTLTLRVE